MCKEILDIENQRCATCLKPFSEHRKISIDQYICTDEGYKNYWLRRAIEYPYAVVINGIEEVISYKTPEEANARIEQLKMATIKKLKK